MSTTPSTNMNMPIPNVGNEAGSQWATDLNNCFNILDVHDHTPGGGGLQITPNALNINSSLTFSNHALTNAQFLGMFLQTVDPATLGCLYYKGVDLYFNDGSSNHIRLTASGSVSGATGTITGLPSGTASASYQGGSGTFVFQSATNTAAIIDGQSFILRNSSASSKGLTLSPPAAMGADIAMTFPAIPGSTQAMNMASSGAMGTISYDAIGQAMTSTGANSIATVRTRATGTTVAAGGVAISASSGAFLTAATSFTDVTNLSVTITTSGRPVFVGLMDDGTAVGSNILILNSTTTADMVLKILRGASSISLSEISQLSGSGASGSLLQIPSSSIFFIDVVGAGTYTYKIQVKNQHASQTLEVNFTSLIVYEL
jgi:hypothetical protein